MTVHVRRKLLQVARSSMRSATINDSVDQIAVTVEGCCEEIKNAVGTYLSAARKQGHRLLKTIQLAVIGQPMQLVAGK